MNPDKTHLYKEERRQPVPEEPAPRRRISKTASSSNSRRRADHKHAYRKIILHYGSNAFCWGRQCQLCGRIDAAYKASSWGTGEFRITAPWERGSWEAFCLGEIHQRYPDVPILTLQDRQWNLWP